MKYKCPKCGGVVRPVKRRYGKCSKCKTRYWLGEVGQMKSLGGK